MRRLLFIVLAAGLAGPGCTSTGKKPPAKPTGRDRPKDSVPFWDDGRPGPRPVGTNDDKKDAPPREVDGLIAGMLIDSNGRPLPNAVVNVTPAEAGPGAKPIGVQADDQGYFMIKGLKSGTNYFLAVRGEDGGKVLGGSALTQAPNARMLIRLTEGNVSSVTPPPVVHPGDAGPFAPDKAKPKLGDPPPANNVPAPEPVPKDPLKEGTDASWSPGKTPPASRPVPPPPPAAGPKSPNVADMAKTWPPTANIPGPGTGNVLPPPPPASPSMSATPANSSPISVPDRQQPPAARNFTLYDLAGEPVQFKNLTDRRLILLDFWSTTCMPCLRSMPDLIELQAKYADYLTVAGVACDDAPWERRKAAVEGVRRGITRTSKRPINFNFYLEGKGKEGQLQREFRVAAYPTLVLLDHTGKVLYRATNLVQMEGAIEYYLTGQR